MSAAGATYMFGLYSADIKSSLGYDQTTLNLLSFFKDLGGNFRRRRGGKIAVVLEDGVPAAEQGGRLHDPPGAVQPRHADPVRRDDLRRRRDADGDRQSGPDWDLARVPEEIHQHVRLAGEHMELPGSGRVGFPVGDCPHPVQVPPAVDVHDDPPLLLRRPPPDRVQRPRRAVRCVDRDRVLLRSPMAAPFRDHIGDLRAQVLLHALQLRVRRQRPGRTCSTSGSRGICTTRRRGSSWRRWVGSGSRVRT
ncbi:unnamed protein product [Linum tenue]|uniref:Nodulin-like domain-containing protein n=1 Tax=Linum tenue TaxID=586396 RepID=A0AAV0JLT2_9ROSI|nr:unnamed protein product [Linum tenue]